MRRFLPLTALVLVLAAGSVAIAQQPGGPGPKFGRGHGPGPGGFGLLEFDANADGKLTRAEFDNAQRTRFNQMDGDKDGFVTRQERMMSEAARHEEAAKARFAALDTDKNGQLSPAEYFAAQHQTPRGEAAFRRELARDMSRTMREFDRGEPSGRQPGFGRDGRSGPDADNDGKVSFAEFSARGTEAFTRADTNKDGTVTIAELQALSRGPR